MFDEDFDGDNIVMMMMRNLGEKRGRMMGILYRRFGHCWVWHPACKIVLKFITIVVIRIMVIKIMMRWSLIILVRMIFACSRRQHRQILSQNHASAPWNFLMLIKVFIVNIDTFTMQCMLQNFLTMVLVASEWLKPSNNEENDNKDWYLYSYIQILYAIPCLSFRHKKSRPSLFSNSPVVWDDQRLMKLTNHWSSFCPPSPCSKMPCYGSKIVIIIIARTI